MVPMRGVLGRFWSYHDGCVYMFATYAVLRKGEIIALEVWTPIHVECPDSGNRLQREQKSSPCHPLL